MEDKNKTSNVKKSDFTSILIAFIIDIFLVFLVYFGLYAIVVKVPGLSDIYASNRTEAIKIQDNYKIENELAYKLYDTDADYKLDKYKDYIVYVDDIGNYKAISKTKAEITTENYNKYIAALNNNPNYNNATFMISFMEYLMRIIAAFGSELILLFIIPMVNKNRSTIGRLSTKTILTNKRNGFEATRWQIFARFVYTFLIQTALLSLYLNPIIVLLIILAVNSLFIIIGKQRRSIKDFITMTKVINLENFVSVRYKAK